MSAALAPAAGFALALGLTASGIAGAPAAEMADPKADLKAFQAYFYEKFPDVKHEDFVNGPYSMDAGMRKQWEEKEEFPPYDFAIDKGKELFETPFKNGKTFADCFENGGIGIRQTYPRFDAKLGEVVTLEYAVNLCLTENGEKPYSYVKDEMAAVTAYMAFTSRGKPFAIEVPNDPRALAAYEAGKQYFYTRRGQLNFSCASCHVQNPGNRIRAEVLAPAFGITAALPIYRSEWGGMGTATRRYMSCNSQVRGTPLAPDDVLYRDVDYFLSFMSNGLPISGPGARP
ncbi:sulfur oxidation protein [Methylobacterium sp. 4-46]|uniref:sulfur oxidation c-type cytochrome SoxA n=1 Tax=unclassified Methylobacterium TaxID=2615210 RepID=UPI000152D7C2|nr:MULTISPECIES: sulfur oxidation c-type cytochrome SoxA [Methylobacterium]ACA14728.1 sulfur oxidation protein [Methylobacterium sp. 4-46]WFT80479.1 sulfur oxidation c-type cytochrome SoxA [Methylobacterium nodulans]